MVYVRVHVGSGDVCKGKSVLLTQIETGILQFPPLQFAILRSVKVAMMCCSGSCECKTFLVLNNDSNIANKAFGLGHVRFTIGLTFESNVINDSELTFSWR